MQYREPSRISTRLLPAPATETAVRKRPVGLWLLCGLVLVTCVLLALSLAEIF